MTSDQPNDPAAPLELLTPVQGGQMLARQSGQVIFVHGGIPGELVTVADIVAKRGYREAAASSVTQAAASRTTPPCPFYGENGQYRGSIMDPVRKPGLVCGGCQYQHIEYQAQLAIKQQIVGEQLRRVGKIVDAAVEPAVPSPSPYAYRNRAGWLVTEGGDLAYHEARSHRLVAIDDCLLLTPGLARVLRDLRAATTQLQLAGAVRGIEARSLSTGDAEAASLALAFDSSISGREAVAIAEALLDHCPTVHSVAGSDADRLSEPAHLAGAPRIAAAFLDARFSLSPTTFFQVNLPVAEAMVQHVLQQLGPMAGKLVLDVYCGAGTFTLPLSRQANAVVGLEADAMAVADARGTFARYGVDNVTFLEGDAGASLKSLMSGTVACTVIDPPRTGCSPVVLHQLARIKAPRLVYVSCDPATLARDLRVLLDHGYRIEQLQPFDLFPQTAHIECVASLKLPKKYQA